LSPSLLTEKNLVGGNERFIACCQQVAKAATYTPELRAALDTIINAYATGTDTIINYSWLILIG
jgi:hypothetical protein